MRNRGLRAIAPAATMPRPGSIVVEEVVSQSKDFDVWDSYHGCYPNPRIEERKTVV